MSQLILASQSPRRKKLLQEAGIIFTPGFVSLSEKLNKNLSLVHAVEDLACQKSRAFRGEHPELKSRDIVILSADTLVTYKSEVLGKPKSSKEAFRHLRLLSGTRHQVITAFCFYNALSGKEFSDHEVTQVYFKELKDTEIQSYIDTGEPMDKAGSYGIQGLGGAFVKKFEGSWTNVVGLPMELLQATIQKNNWTFDPLSE